MNSEIVNRLKFLLFCVRGKCTLPNLAVLVRDDEIMQIIQLHTPVLIGLKFAFNCFSSRDNELALSFYIFSTEKHPNIMISQEYYHCPHYQKMSLVPL